VPRTRHYLTLLWGNHARRIDLNLYMEGRLKYNGTFCAHVPRDRRLMQMSRYVSRDYGTVYVNAIRARQVFASLALTLRSGQVVRERERERGRGWGEERGEKELHQRDIRQLRYQLCDQLCRTRHRVAVHHTFQKWAAVFT